MLKRNKKNVLIGVCALAGVALTSVGFATWIVGVTNKDTSLQYNVQVDDVSSDTVYLSCNTKVGNIKIGEKTPKTNKGKTDIAGTDDLSSFKNALEFSIKDITLKIGTSVAENVRPNKLKLSLNYENGLNAANVVTDGNNLLTKDGSDTKVRTGTEYHYLQLQETIDLTYGTTSDATTSNMVTDDSITNGYKTYKFTKGAKNEYVSSLLWGNYFGNDTSEATVNKSPVTYYNALYAETPEAKLNLDHMLKSAGEAHQEIAAMKTALSGGAKLTISIKAVYEEAHK